MVGQREEAKYFGCLSILLAILIFVLMLIIFGTLPFDMKVAISKGALVIVVLIYFGGARYIINDWLKDYEPNRKTVVFRILLYLLAFSLFSLATSELWKIPLE
jgi:uncharacterized membrane-anchored protein